MNQNLKKLFVIKPTKDVEDKNEVKDQEDELRQISLTFYQSGYGDSKNAMGGFQIFKECLEQVYANFKHKCRLDEKEQKKLKQPFVQAKEAQIGELNKQETLMSIKEAGINDLMQDISKIDEDLVNVKNDPEKYGIDANKRPKAQFYIGLLLLLPITLYLVVFYISASYSAFFRDFNNADVVAAIFDANALTNALQASWLETTFITTIPFAFMGLGYLIHMFLKEKKTGLVKVFALLIITFMFDSILAYLIELKIYNFDKLITDPQFDLPIAFSRIDFWGIIFAGFVVYIIWGLVFDFVMKEYENIDKIKIFIEKLKKEKENYIKLKKDFIDAINEIKQEIAITKGKITEAQSRIDGFIFPQRQYLRYHYEYSKGWYIAVAKELHLPKKEKNELIEECNSVSKDHLIKHNFNEDEFENINFTNAE